MDIELVLYSCSFVLNKTNHCKYTYDKNIVLKYAIFMGKSDKANVNIKVDTVYNTKRRQSSTQYSDLEDCVEA